jgi:hypothetical protein
MQLLAALLSIVSMGTLIVLQLANDLGVLGRRSFLERIRGGSLTTIELMLFWAAIGAVLYALALRRKRQLSDPLR